MSTISSKQAKRQGFRNPDLALVFTLLIGILAISGSFAGSIYFFFPEPLGNVSSNVPDSEGLSFSSDQQYWDANCSHGWASDSMCDAIVIRTKVCATDIPSAYCSHYDNYLQQFYDRKPTTTAYFSGIR